MLLGSSTPLVDRYDLAMLDLDGVVYVGPDAVPGAAEAIEGWRSHGSALAFITNNASRPAERVAEHLLELGVEAQAQDVVTSSQAVASLMQRDLGNGARVVALGAAGLVEPLETAGLTVVGPDDSEAAAAVVTGYGPDVAWKDIMKVAVLLRDGLRWYATNTDMTIPTPFGVAPGHGVQVEMLRRFSGREPIVAGKPSAPLLEVTMERVGGERPLMVGDRLDTDIRGGRNAGVDTLLVLTGVTGLSELAAAVAEERPDHLALDLGGLLESHVGVVEQDGRATCEGWEARVSEGRLSVDGDGPAVAWWRSAAVALWRHLDSTGSPADVDGVDAPG